MNAFANSQGKKRHNSSATGLGLRPPMTYARYTVQEDHETRPKWADWYLGAADE